MDKFQKSIGEYYYTQIAKDKEDNEEEAKLKKKK
jgi:hypothetical protein